MALAGLQETYDLIRRDMRAAMETSSRLKISRKAGMAEKRAGGKREPAETMRSAALGAALEYLASGIKKATGAPNHAFTAELAGHIFDIKKAIGEDRVKKRIRTSSLFHGTWRDGEAREGGPWASAEMPPPRVFLSAHGLQRASASAVAALFGDLIQTPKRAIWKIGPEGKLSE